MIIFGSRSAHIKSIQLTNAICQNCDTQGSIIISLFRKHAHIFWIPVFPFSKTSVSQCQNCKNVLEEHEMSESIQQHSHQLKSETKGPIWQFSGLFLIGLLIIWIQFNSIEKTKEKAAYLAAPLIGDVYEYKMESGEYSTFKIIEPTKDSIIVSQNEYMIDRMAKIYTIDKVENYKDDIYIIAKDQLKEMDNEGNILAINR